MWTFHFSLFGLLRFLITLEGRQASRSAWLGGMQALVVGHLVLSQLHCFLAVWPCLSPSSWSLNFLISKMVILISTRYMSYCMECPRSALHNRTFSDDGNFYICIVCSSVFFFFKLYYWSIIALQCWVSFCCTRKWISCMYTYIPTLFYICGEHV